MLVAPSAKIPPVKTGIDFLASSHFNIGNNHKIFNHKSTFQHDYPLQKVEKAQSIKQPPPASIFHGDRRINEQCSVNKEQFRKHDMNTQKIISKNSLTKTNFKMDHDSSVETFNTTNNIYHYAMPLGLSNTLTKEPMKSYIPQGDKSKEVCVRSLYKEDFPQKHKYDQDSKKNIVSGKSNVMKGDSRCHGNNAMFDTTSRRDLPAYHGHTKALIPGHIHYPKTSIPCGNEENSLSTTQIDFKKKLPPISPSSFEHKKSPELQKTQYKIGDIRLNDFITIGHDYGTYDHSDTTPAAAVDMRKSNFPPGDGVPVGERDKTTMNLSDFKAPPNGFRNPIVDGSNLRTASNVDFGDDKVNYQTTTKSTFHYKQGNYVKSGKMHRSFTLHENNHANDENLSSYSAAYKSTYGVKKLTPNPIAIENLKKSYIVEPIRGLREFSTTHRESYTPKELSLMHVDTHNMHKSSVPIGFMSK